MIFIAKFDYKDKKNNVQMQMHGELMQVDNKLQIKHRPTY